MNETHTNSSARQLRRTKNGRLVAGVCSGVGEHIGVDPNILRVALAVATFFGGLGVGIYAVAWLLIPEEDKNSSIVQDLVGKNKDGQVWQDAKTRWDRAQQAWSQPVRQPAEPYRQDGGYQQHPYAQPRPSSNPQEPQGPQA
ncbi:PspC domain-containing protein [Microtetraspora niveoalba]|uniref:PspC domain-containing protein n=1 Tax=Microtetraspora niveoalba TaxID=46175 RepID=UPI000829E540|nr:PspC domain-containing protein [Microtetraspora niveoalba]